MLIDPAVQLGKGGIRKTTREKLWVLAQCISDRDRLGQEQRWKLRLRLHDMLSGGGKRSAATKR
jgi:hypothetical protein